MSILMSFFFFDILASATLASFKYFKCSGYDLPIEAKLVVGKYT